MAVKTFGNELGVQVIHYLAENPVSPEGAIADAVGVPVELALADMVETGVLVQGGDRTYSVDEARFRELIKALEDFGSASSS